MLRNLLLCISLSLFFACTHQARFNIESGTRDELSQLLIDSLIRQSRAEFNNLKGTDEFLDHYLREAEAIAEKNKQFKKQTEVYNEVAKRYRNVSAFGKAITYYQKALDIANAINDDKIRAYTTHEMAVALRRIDNNADALKLHIQVLGWAEAVKDTFLIHSSLNGIGNVYLSYNNILEAIGYFHRSLNYLGSNPRNLLGEAINTNNIGEGWLQLNRPDSAEIYLKKSYDINVQIGSMLGQAICQNGFGNIAVNKKDYSNAIQHFSLSLELNRKIGDLIYVSDNLRNLGTSYLAMNNLVKAEKYLKDAVTMSETIGSKTQVFESTKALGKLYAQLNKPQLALKYLEKSLAYKDSITQEISRQNAEAVEVLYQAEKQAREIIILKQQAQLKELNRLRERWFLFSVMLFLVLGVGTLLIVLRQRRLKNRFKEIELEQKLFRSQLNPHFLFNSLTAVQNFIIRNDKMAAFDYLANFARLMRSILMSSKNELTTLEKEAEMLDDYLKLQQLRFQGKFDYSIFIDKNLDKESTYLPPMMVQPFIENAVEHGVQALAYKGQIDVRFKSSGENILIEVEDNGVGLKENETPKKEGYVSMATQIIKQRIETIKHQTQKNCKFEIINKDAKFETGGVLIRLLLPIYTER
jgi:tetratricopeptide (TPR) repeat protein